MLQINAPQQLNMKTKKLYKIPSIKVIQIESDAILVDSHTDPTQPVNLRLDLEDIEEEGYAE